MNGPAQKVFKINGGQAYIRLTENTVTLGVGSNVFITLTEDSVNIGGSSLNLQMEPSSVKYNVFLQNSGAVAGMIPLTPQYGLNVSSITAFTNLMQSMALVRSATGI